jgi:hypothetical protein
VQLYRNGTSYGEPITLSAGNGWAYTWAGLDRGSVWTVDEPTVPPGYTKTVTGNAASGFVVTNTRRPTPPPGLLEQVTVSGKKTWDHRDHKDNPETPHPSHIILHILADGELIIQRRISEAENWSWSYTLDKSGMDGREIVYTVDEEAVPGYVKKVDGYNIHNTGTARDERAPDPKLAEEAPGAGIYKPGYEAPKTSDDSNIPLWLTVMALSLISLAVLIYIARKKRYKPKH